MNPDRSDRPRLVDEAQRALLAVHAGADEHAIDEISTEHIGELVMLLFGECSTMVSELGDGGATPVQVQVFDEEGTEVSIDSADPPVRTAVRTLLAEVHGNPGAAAEQVEIALANAAPGEMHSLVLQALRWTSRLAAECVSRDLPVSPWLADTLQE
ncbi:hypothetical protein SAMN06265360_12726 [Haloechinothrix alba]|uniref:Uncharacterized protein n=1 Tax=Haloechinothrix alba TaxID=664784 RepID=A0A238ZY63_9PSEU|nr:hypothetical protein [Haloechinothrix alba]SNR88260.1 hypothetical protein SAMN06265360_12726 [Haloechinothrix alba]